MGGNTWKIFQIVTHGVKRCENFQILPWGTARKNTVLKFKIKRKNTEKILGSLLDEIR